MRFDRRPQPATTPPALTRRACLAAACAVLAAPAAAQDDAVVAFGPTRVRFADEAQGRAVLIADDEWMGATSTFQRRAVMGSAAPVSLDAFRRWNGDAVRPWSDEQRARWRTALRELAPSFAALRVPLPDEVLLVASNGQESAQAPYTRGRAVVLPGVARMPGFSDAKLLAHELWHVAARHAPATATRLYTQIGFEPIAELRFPAAWQDIRIANPDAPNNRHAMRLRFADGRSAMATPVLVAQRTELQAGETFFTVMDVRLLEVLPGSGGAPSTAVLRDGTPVWHALDGPHDYLKQLGGNTGYVIHPEEAIADNVALLATGAPARNPALLERLKAALLAG
jgi:hypothetical protein